MGKDTNPPGLMTYVQFSRIHTVERKPESTLTSYPVFYMYTVAHKDAATHRHARTHTHTNTPCTHKPPCTHIHTLNKQGIVLSRRQ